MRLECDTFLFDLDGVLIDSSSCVERHWRAWAGKHGIDMAAIMANAHGRRTVETVRLVAPNLDCEKEAEQLTAIEVADSEGVVAMPGASSLLGKLPRNAWALVTSANRELALARLEYTGLPVPEIMVTAEDVKDGKPAPEPYLLGAKRMGLPPERCVVVEDAPAGIQSARAAGMRVIAVATTHKKQDLVDVEGVIDSLDAMDVSVGGRVVPGWSSGFRKNIYLGDFPGATHPIGTPHGRFQVRRTSITTIRGGSAAEGGKRWIYSMFSLIGNPSGAA